MADDVNLPLPTFNGNYNGGGLLDNLFPSSGQGLGGSGIGLGDLGLLAAGGALGGAPGAAIAMGLRFLPQLLNKLNNSNTATGASAQATSAGATTPSDAMNPMPDLSKLSPEMITNLMATMKSNDVNPYGKTTYQPGVAENAMGTSMSPNAVAARVQQRNNPMTPFLPYSAPLSATPSAPPAARLTQMSPRDSWQQYFANNISPVPYAGLMYQIMKNSGRTGS